MSKLLHYPRGLSAFMVLWCAGFGIWDLAHAWYLAPFVFALVLGQPVLFVVNTKRIRRAGVEARRPDYAAIARMERDVWGEAFSHAGAPQGPAGMPIASAADLARTKARLGGMTMADMETGFTSLAEVMRHSARCFRPQDCTTEERR